MAHLFQGEWADIKPAFFTRWVAPAWFMAVLWVHFVYPHTIVSALLGPVFAMGLIVLTEVDRRTFTLPNLVTLPMAVIGVGAAATQGQALLMNGLLGLVLGYLSFSLIQFGSLKIMKKDGLGPGDVKFFAAIGAWVGATGLPLVALVASFAAMGWILAVRHPKRQRLPFGPFLAVGAWITYLYQYDIWAFLGYIHN